MSDFTQAATKEELLSAREAVFELLKRANRSGGISTAYQERNLELADMALDIIDRLYLPMLRDDE